ncbi:DUF1653 domain-containing protein [Candidatus Woesearchaeota archaeon]|nr:DUF1653 domain-containing protein [Candidatus Woesearchaeota archaeon]
MIEIKKGKYKHFKGKEYEVIGVVKHSETLKDMILYKPLYDSDVELWVRPATEFNDIIEKDGKKIKRFEKID